MSYEASHVITVNGVSLHYAVVGEGRPVVLVHGNGETHDLFDTEIRRLADAAYRVYAPDSRGHGANEPLEEYHYTDMAEDMFCLIRELGLERPALYGHSDGGIIGLLLAIRHPDALGVLAVSGTNLSPDGIDPSFIREFTEINKKRPDPLITLMLTEPDIAPEELGGIAIPVLVTVGEHDLILPSEAQKIAAGLPHAELKIIEGADHGSYIDGSEVMGELLIQFFEKEWKEEAES